jgi:hypothetical protein
MLISLLMHQPQMLGTILRHTPAWVGALLAGLVWLGLSQARDRETSLARIAITPVAMMALSIWGMVSAFGSSPMFGYAMLMWMFAGAVTFASIGMTRAPRGTQYHPATRTFFLPGSWVPLLLIAGIFITRYVVNVDVAMQPGLARDGQYTLIVGAVYGLCSGIFIGRAARLWRLAAERGRAGLALQCEPHHLLQ